MRTTVTLDDDLTVRLERLCQEQGRSFKAVINEVIRAGLDSLQRIPEQRSSGESVSYTEPIDLGPPVRTDLIPSELLALTDEEDDIKGLDVPR